MDANALPTKRNLLLAKQSLILARKGHDLLDMKYNALLRELKRAEKTANKIREKLHRLLFIAERALVIAKMEIGEGKFQEIWELISWDSLPNLQYKLYETCAAVDEAVLAWEQVFSEEKKLAKIEETLTNLKARSNRTKKRASALRNIAIPSYEQRVKYITDQLEEHERDEMIRLKVARQ